MIRREPVRDDVDDLGSALENCPAGAERPGPQEAELSHALRPSLAQDGGQDRDQEDREEYCHGVASYRRSGFAPSDTRENCPGNAS
jgi:hypothetical protein